MKKDPYVKLARQTIEHYFNTKKILERPTDLPTDMIRKEAGVFVTLKKNGDLRGCIGTVQPTRESVADEIIQNAISAAFRDPRFPPLEEKELDKVDISVDELLTPEPIDSIDELDPKKYGVIVYKEKNSGLLLPNIEGVDTAQDQVNIALRKAGIYKSDDYELQRFEVVRHHE
ncbi:MAG: AmmeMemoRadiSam system protein A [Candidatus Izemoplasmatales bacterium]